MLSVVDKKVQMWGGNVSLMKTGHFVQKLLESIRKVG